MNLNRIVHADEVAHPRADLLPPFPAVEDAVVADRLLLVVHPHRRRPRREEVVSGAGLAQTGDVVALAFASHQRRAPNHGRLNPPAASRTPPHRHRLLPPGRATRRGTVIRNELT